ncbi:hypothetical protein BD779DRAFT_1499586 [Infundibulicybe gibba]|nr:hypothetical protein BD779DRAFT_1499586 [Infundibulicybe gibba]
MLFLLLQLGSFIAISIIIYLHHLSSRLSNPHPDAQPCLPFTEQQLSDVSYEGIDMLKAIPPKATHSGYAIIGGSGFLGTGETNIRVLDLEPPPPEFDSNPALSFIKTDITALPSVRYALTRPFETTGNPPNVIYHTAALIRFWDRLSYCWNTSYNVNVRGTQNILTVAKELPGVSLIYTSTADVAVPRPKFFDWGSAEELVVQANGQGSLITGSIRPGFTIIGPNDRLITSTLTMPRVPTWDKVWSATNICMPVREPEEVCGQTFLVSGNGPAWRIKETREAVKYYADHPVYLDDIPPLLIFILAHVIELLLALRYYTLLPFTDSLLKPSLNPKWLGQAVYLQPSTLEYMSDIVIDHSRARKLLGYQPQWETAQCVRYAVDEVQLGRTNRKHGLQLKSEL